MADVGIEQLCRRAFSAINAGLFGGELKGLRFRIDPTCKQSCQWSSSSGMIAIGPEMRAQSPLGFKVALIHEMIHILNDGRGLGDLSVNSYHNKFFARAALEAGLFVLRHKNRGWCLLSTVLPTNITDRKLCKVPSLEAHERLLSVLRSFQLTRKDWYETLRAMRQEMAGGKQTRTFLYKYKCGCPDPHNSIRCGRRPDGPNRPDITCNRCGQVFVGII